ncbi:MAG: EFR1 family ferrodoxin [Eubacteriales bacterium]|nr:EFR1 family ferrodoxin [Eubacteriales bacterium]
MKHIVYYFSGTGNSLNVAKELEKNGAEVYSIASIMKKCEKEKSKEIICDANKVGIVFPLYYLGMPKILHEFMEKLVLIHPEYVYMICTMGWNLKGGAIVQMKKYLNNKKVTLNMGSYLHMPMNDFTFASVCKIEKQKKIITASHKKIKKIIEMVNQSKNHFDIEPIRSFMESSNAPFIKRVSGEDKNFKISDKCTSCGICERVCSCDNIKLVDGKPVWQYKCQSCFACFHYCPVKAIQYEGKNEQVHYHHPDISVNELEKYKNKLN